MLKGADRTQSSVMLVTAQSHKSLSLLRKELEEKPHLE